MIEEDLFTQALEFPAEERTAFLREACGDDEALRASVDALLAAHEEEGSLIIDRPSKEAQALSGALDSTTHGGGGSREDGGGEDSIGMTKGGKIRVGDYVLEEEIARGAMGIVYRANQKSLKRKVAVKMIRWAMLANDEDVARFRMEAEAAAALNHPNIVPIHEVGEVDGQHFFSMQLIEGGTLTDKLEELRKDPKKAAKLMSTVARAIHAAHQHGILHRDIKPGNILIDQKGEPHVTDFGLAKQVESNSSMTVSGQIMGTPYYMAPEQAEGGTKDLTTAADVYSLGAVFYQVLTGTPPHKGESLVDTLKMVVEKDPAAPRTIVRAIDPDLETIVLKCLDKDSESRYPSAAGLANDLDRWLAGEPVTARPVGSVVRLVKWAKRRPVHAAAWALAAAFLLTLGIGGPIVALKQADLRKQADAERAHAVEAGEKEAAARALADEARALADRRAEEIRRNLYLAEMNMASEALAASSGVGRIRTYLNRWVPAPGEDDLRGWEWRYLDALLNRELLAYQGHTGKAVRAVAWGPVGDRIVSAVQAGEICGWDPDSGKTLFRSGGSRKPKSVEWLAWSPDGARFLSAGTSGPLRVHDGATGDVLAEVPFRDAGPTAAAWSPDSSRIASGWSDGWIRFIDPATGNDLDSIQAHQGLVIDVAWSPDGAWLASGTSKEMKVKVWNGQTGEQMREMETAREFHSLAWSSDGRFLALAQADGVLEARDAASGEVLHTFEGHEDLVADVAWSPDDRWLASAGWDHTVRIWEMATGKSRAKFRGTDKAWSVGWSPDGRRLAAVIGGKTKIYPAGSEDIRTLRGGAAYVSSVQWHPAGNRLLSADSDTTVRIWPIGRERPAREFAEHRLGLHEAAWNPDGERVASLCLDGKLLVWEAETGKTLHALESPLKEKAGDIESFQWSPDGSRLASIAADNVIRIWDADSGENVAVFEVNRRPGRNRIAWSPDGRWLAVPAYGRVEILNAETGDKERDLECYPAFVFCLAWSPAGDRVAIGHQTGLIQILDVEEEREPLDLAGHDTATQALAWGPDGTRLASGGMDRSLRVWDTATGAQCLHLRVHDDAVLSMDWSPDGASIATASRDGTIKLWDSVRR